MPHTISTTDRDFLRAFTAGEIYPADFHHRDHVRLAYIFLTQHAFDDALEKMRGALQSFIHAHGIDAEKYHATMTQAWLLAVRHFLHTTNVACVDAEDFLQRNPQLLDPDIMLTHYSRERLHSDAARRAFTPPDLERIPENSKD